MISETTQPMLLLSTCVPSPPPARLDPQDPNDDGQVLESRRRGSTGAAATLNRSRAVFIPPPPINPQRHAHTRAPQIPSPTPLPTQNHGAAERHAPPTRRGRPACRRGPRRRPAVVRAHRVPGVRRGGQRQRVRDPAVQGRDVGVHRAHRGHLARRRHPLRFPPAFQVHPGEERLQRDDRDDGAGADARGAQRRTLLRLLLRGQLLRAGEESGRPAGGRGPARAEVGRGEVRGRPPVRRLRGRRRRRQAGRAARSQPAGDQVGRRRFRRPQGRPGVRVHRGAVQLAVRVQWQGQRDMDALRYHGRV